MKNLKFLKPEIEIITISHEEIITTSTHESIDPGREKDIKVDGEDLF